MAKIRIGVLRGGPSSEYEISLKTGENVLKFLPEKFQGYDILITRDGKWHFDGVERTPDQIFRRVDVVFNALHGEFGEDGKVQQIFEHYKIPFTGSGSFSSALAMNKLLAKQAFEAAGIKTPRGFAICRSDDLNEVALRIFKNFSPPWVLKPINKGSSVGVKIIGGFNDLKKAMLEVFNVGYHASDLSDIWRLKPAEKIIFEEYISGKEATCGILENFRRQKHYALPVVEIIPKNKELRQVGATIFFENPHLLHASARKDGGDDFYSRPELSGLLKNRPFFDYEAKYSGETQEILPANFDLKTKRKIEEIAKKAHRFLGCRVYSRSDFIVSRRGIFFLEINTLPGLTSESLLPKSAAAIGINFSDLLEHLIKSERIISL